LFVSHLVLYSFGQLLTLSPVQIEVGCLVSLAPVSQLVHALHKIIPIDLVVFIHFTIFVLLFCFASLVLLCFCDVFSVLTLNRDWRSARRLSRLGLCLHSHVFCGCSLFPSVLSHRRSSCLVFDLFD